MAKHAWILILSSLVLLLSACDKVDSCLDSGGCWDKVDGVCRKTEFNAQELCDRKSTKFSPKDILEDYLALRNHISQSYANLEYLLKYYKIDPYALNEKTIGAIKAAKTEKDALDALLDFVKTFRDGHFQLKKSGPNRSEKRTSSSIEIDSQTDPKLACEALDFTWDKKFSFRFPVEGVSIVKRDDGEFPFLVVEKGPSRIGVIRIADFRDTVYPQTCIETWKRYAHTLTKKCDEACRDQFLHTELRNALVDKFYEVLKTVQNSKIKALIIDLTRNGGGTDWVKDITALLTEKKLICGRRGFVKHPHYVKNFTEQLQELKSATKKNVKEIKKLEQKLKLASESCDRTPLWTEKGFKLSCSLVGYYDGDSCKYEDVKLRGKSRYKGKLFFLVDDYTASAAEDIVARHLDSKSAVVIGGHTHGSGCGYINGGIKFTLPHTGLEVKVPDCIRERADGTNEVVGIEPTMKMEMANMSSPAFLRDLIDQVTLLIKDEGGSVAK